MRPSRSAEWRGAVCDFIGYLAGEAVRQTTDKSAAAWVLKRSIEQGIEAEDLRLNPKHAKSFCLSVLHHEAVRLNPPTKKDTSWPGSVLVGGRER